MRRNKKLLAAIALLGTGLLGIHSIVDAGWSQATAVDEGIKRIAQGQDPIPGARDCFWSRGPASKDPYINIAYPDSATYYWAAAFSIPKDAQLRIEGNFPHSRYMSFISYDAKGRPIESVADYLIQPKQGSTNPFLSGAHRATKDRAYQLDVVDGDPPSGQAVGMNLKGETRASLHAPKYGSAPGQQVVLYRIYATDKNVDETGGVGLPKVTVIMADGKMLKGTEACQALRTKQPLQLDPAAMAVPMNKYYELIDAAKKISPTHPATSPATFYQQLDRESLYGMYQGILPRADAPKSEGGFYPNLDNQYIRTILNRKLGKVFVLRAKAPTTPKTVNGDAEMGTGDLRYWSWCSNQGFANTRVNDCVHDENIPVGPDGYYTLVVSRAADRPRNAVAQCGIAWLPMADDGDGAVDEDVTILQLRHMLGAGEFIHAIQNIKTHVSMETDMGDYFPKSRYTTTSAFETAQPCLIQKR